MRMNPAHASVGLTGRMRSTRLRTIGVSHTGLSIVLSFDGRLWIGHLIL